MINRPRPVCRKNIKGPLIMESKAPYAVRCDFVTLSRRRESTGCRFWNSRRCRRWHGSGSTIVQINPVYCILSTDGIPDVGNIVFKQLLRSLLRFGKKCAIVGGAVFQLFLRLAE